MLAGLGAVIAFPALVLAACDRYSGCADLEVFRRLGFRAAPRKLRLLLGALRPDITGLPETVDRFCLDVF